MKTTILGANAQQKRLAAKVKTKKASNGSEARSQKAVQVNTVHVRDWGGGEHVTAASQGSANWTENTPHMERKQWLFSNSVIHTNNGTAIFGFG